MLNIYEYVGYITEFIGISHFKETIILMFISMITNMILLLLFDPFGFFSCLNPSLFGPFL